MIKLGIFVSLIIISLTVLGQNQYGDPTVQFSKSQYKKDFRQYVKLLKKNHPQVYTFVSKKEFNTLKKQKLRGLSDSTSLGQFLWACEDIAAAVQCAHTFVWWPNDFGLIPDSLFFPVDTWTDGTKLYVVETRNNKNKLDTGSEILSINGVDFKTIINAMYASSPSDGNIESSKRNWINHLFNTMCPMYFNYPEHYSVEVEINGEIKAIQLEKYQRRNSESTQSNACTDRLCIEIDSIHQTGILTIKSFDYYEDDFSQFKSFIDNSFTAINHLGLEHLVIDLRGNQGGDSKCGAYLIEHIADQPFCYWPIDNAANWEKELHQAIQPNPNRFKGKPYILIDGGCLSTSGHVGSIIKANAFGIFVGEEMGSTYICNDNSLFDTLNYTSLQFRIPQTTYSTCITDFPRNKGIMPDIEILPSINDIIYKLDPVMEYVMKQIKLNEQH